MSAAPQPANRGYAIPAVAPRVAAAAPEARAAAILGSPAIHEIPSQPATVWDQADLPCCVSCAASSALEILRGDGRALSPLFHYFVTRFDLQGSDASGYLDLDVALHAACMKGISQLALHRLPFTTEGTTTRPSQAAYADAATRALGGNPFDLPYSQASGTSRVAWIRDQLLRNHPVLIGFRTPTGYPDGFLNGSYEWLDPAPERASGGGHCVLATGFSDLRQAVHVRDSQGAAKFEQGGWWMGYRVLDSLSVSTAYALKP